MLQCAFERKCWDIDNHQGQKKVERKFSSQKIHIFWGQHKSVVHPSQKIDGMEISVLKKTFFVAKK